MVDGAHGTGVQGNVQVQAVDIDIEIFGDVTADVVQAHGHEIRVRVSEQTAVVVVVAVPRILIGCRVVEEMELRRVGLRRMG